MSQIKRLQTIDADTLQSTAYEPVSFVVDDLLPQGLHLLAGAPKIGKSWLALWLCLCAAQGKPLWTFATRPCEVLYLCLEDSFQRINHPAQETHSPRIQQFPASAFHILSPILWRHRTPDWKSYQSRRGITPVSQRPYAPV